MNCEHKRIKKNYPFGKKSKPVMFCKDCKEVITRYELKLNKRRRRWKQTIKKKQNKN